MRFVPLLAAIILVFTTSTPTFAATTLNAVRVDATPTGGALVSVNFSGSPPTYHVVGAGNTRDIDLARRHDARAAGPSVRGGRRPGDERLDRLDRAGE